MSGALYSVQLNVRRNGGGPHSCVTHLKSLLKTSTVLCLIHIGALCTNLLEGAHD